MRCRYCGEVCREEFCTEECEILYDEEENE